jgi:L-lactate utilization protein LutC
MNTDEARSAIFAAIRAATGHGRSILAVGLVPQAGPRPRWLEPDVDRFRARLERARGGIQHIKHLAELPKAVRAYLEQHRLGQTLYVTDIAPLRDLDWNELDICTGPIRGDVPVVLSMAYAGIAETGTVVMVSGPATPTTHNFLCEHHLIALHSQALVPYPEDLWQRLRREFDSVPRTINLITGPSRTADIEQTIQLGAHGPRHLHVLIYSDPVVELDRELQARISLSRQPEALVASPAIPRRLP